MRPTEIIAAIVRGVANPGRHLAGALVGSGDGWPALGGATNPAARDFGMPPNSPRAGYRSVTPRIVVSDVAAQVDFFRAVFDAAADVEPGHPAEVHIGDSLIMVSPARECELFAAFLYIYVDDADQVYQQALIAGATTLEAPLDTPYGDRRAMVRDPFGNVLQIAHPITSTT